MSVATLGSWRGRDPLALQAWIPRQWSVFAIQRHALQRAVVVSPRHGVHLGEGHLPHDDNCIFSRVLPEVGHVQAVAQRVCCRGRRVDALPKPALRVLHVAGEAQSKDRLGDGLLLAPVKDARRPNLRGIGVPPRRRVQVPPHLLPLALLSPGLAQLPPVWLREVGIFGPHLEPFDLQPPLLSQVPVALRVLPDAEYLLHMHNVACQRGLLEGRQHVVDLDGQLAGNLDLALRAINHIELALAGLR
mmetsp:Transcript_39498/g.108827  ORF Transcript_39498/g.108827 Transcript_39498/m.108827 type:complete len:246 (+) Transcript_39498:875-1612(+)